MLRFILASFCIFVAFSLPVLSKNWDHHFPTSSSGAINDTLLVITGLILDQKTNKPLKNLTFGLTLYESNVQPSSEDILQLRTDNDGFYFWKGVLKSGPMKNLFTMTSLNPFGYSVLLKFENQKSQLIHSAAISFLRKYDFKEKTNRKTGFAVVRLQRNDQYPIQFPVNFKIDDSLAVRSYMLNQLSIYKTENKLIVGFKQKYPKPHPILTKYGNGYFNRESELVGYEGGIEFYLDGEIVPFETISSVFKNQEPVEIQTDKEYNKLATYMKFYTSGLDAEIPPQNLVNPRNVEWIDPTTFDLSSLGNFPVYVDGYWQIDGIGKKKIPATNEIKRIAIFKGPLANHYNRRFDKVWWIETKPADAVWARPEFEKCGCGL